MSFFFAILMALLHIYIFFLESVFWGKAFVNRLFRVGASDAVLLKKMAFNQGFYNLFLSIELLTGLAFFHLGKKETGTALLVYGALSVLGAGAVLLVSDKKLIRPALIQVLPALLFLVLFVSGF